MPFLKSVWDFTFASHTNEKIIANMGLGSHLHTTQLEMAKLGVRFKPQFDADLDKECKASLAYISDWDDALTAERYNRSETLDKIENKSIFRIHILHHMFYFHREIIEQVKPHDIFICSLSKDLALIFTGEKVSLPQLSGGELYWGQEHVDRARRLIAADRVEKSRKNSQF